MLRHFRAGRHQPGNRHRLGPNGFHTDSGHNRAGAPSRDWPRRFPGNRRHRHYAASHQAQLPGDERRRHRADDQRGLPHRPDRQARTGAGGHTQGPAAGRAHRVHLARLGQHSRLQPPGESRPRAGSPGSQANQRGRTPYYFHGTRCPYLPRLRPGKGTGGEGPDSGGTHLAGHQLISHQSLPEPGNVGYARHGFLQPSHRPSRLAHLLGDAVRRPHYREGQGFRSQRQNSACRHRRLGDR